VISVRKYTKSCGDRNFRGAGTHVGESFFRNRLFTSGFRWGIVPSSGSGWGYIP
jgi:hypothetical protein